MADYSSQFPIRRLWIILLVSMVIMFGVLLYFGNQIYHLAPPIPSAVKSEGGATLFTREQIERGQNVWQSMGGMQQGSIWGHGSYVAPDWSADWLHREALALLDRFAMRERGVGYEALSAADKRRPGPCSGRTCAPIPTMRNRASSPSRTTGRRPSRRSVRTTRRCSRGSSAEAQALREQYAFPVHAKLTADESSALNAFFFWTSWAASTNRPGASITYTSNWPHEPLVGNTPSGAVFMWTFISIFVLLGGIGALVWYYAREFDIWRRDGEPETGFSRNDFMETAAVTPSMRAAARFFIVATAALRRAGAARHRDRALCGRGPGPVRPAAVGSLPVFRHPHLAHAACGALDRDRLARRPGSMSRRCWADANRTSSRSASGSCSSAWSSSWSAAFAGQWLAINRMIPDLTRISGSATRVTSIVDLGRFWQIYLFVGLLLWLVLVLRGLAPALKQQAQSRSLLFLVVVAAVAIGLLFGAGLMYGQHTHISIMEYWRWWVVHLWVEGVFEVFATAIVSALFVRMGLVRVSVATTSVLFATIIFLGGGVLGTFHHLYWSGTPIAVIALGSVFSALEVVPLMVVGFEAYSRAKHEGIYRLAEASITGRSGSSRRCSCGT